MSPRGRIGRFGRVRRRPDHWSSPHERARLRAAERLDAPLAASETAWLDAHLAACEACRSIADAYAADRLLLRQLREETTEPPRDLWARTAADIEREGAAHQPARRPARARRGTSLPALSALSGLAVVGVVVVATAISSGLLGPTGRGDVAPSPSIALASLGIPPQSPAIAVGAGKVHWLGAADDGAFAYNVADIDVVCPIDRQPDCPQLVDGNAKRVTLTATPKFVFQSPIDDQAVVMGTDATGADAVIVVALPTPDPTPVASIGTDPGASTEPSDVPTPSPAPTPTPTSGATPLVELPSDLPSVTPLDLASADPLPSEGTAIAIITDVTVVGRSASYSPDGMWFAFSARPADGSAGPDIYVWHVGDLQARAITTDHASVFGSWVGGNVLGSRVIVASPGSPDESPPLESPGSEPTHEVPPVVEPPPSAEAPVSVPPGPSEAPTPVPELVPQAFLVDPWTSMEIALIDPEWQPVVDPTGLAVVAWQGTVLVGSDGLTASPATGNLVVHPFHGPLVSEDPLASPSLDPSLDPSLEPSLTPSPEVSVSVSVSPSVDVTASASPEVMRDFPSQIVAAGPIADFDARWDETGSWLAIWIADPVDPGLGRLSLLRFDPLTGLIDRPEGAPQDVTALPGFSIGYGRLAWASPPGQGGEGSRIQIAAWTDDQVGAIESIPVEGAIVVQ
ncbi:MAG: zf-HC2 domain-containing protein [Chloroflexota bacterium]